MWGRSLGWGLSTGKAKNYLTVFFVLGTIFEDMGELCAVELAILINRCPIGHLV